MDNEFHYSAEVCNECTGQVNKRKVEETDGENYSLSNLQTSHQLLSFPNLNKGFLWPTLTDVSGSILILIYLLSGRLAEEHRAARPLQCASVYLDTVSVNLLYALKDFLVFPCILKKSSKVSKVA